MSEAQKRPRQPSKLSSEKQDEMTAKNVRTAGKFSGSVLQPLTRINHGSQFRKMEVTTTFINSNVYWPRNTAEVPIWEDERLVVTIQFDPKVVREHKKKKKAKAKEPAVPSDPLTVKLVSTRENTLRYEIDGVDLDTQDGLEAMYTFMTGKALADVLSNIKLNSRTNGIDLESLATKLYPEIVSNIKSTLRAYVRIQHATQSALVGNGSPLVGIEQIF